MNKRAWYSIFSILAVLAALSWLAFLTRPPEKFRLIACDVGQGDAFLVTKGNFQMLVDGGPNNQVLDCLGRYVSFWDRDLEIVVSTHPDSDHYTGLVEVLRRYNVKNVVASEANKDNNAFAEFKKQVALEHANVVMAREGERILSSGIYIDILNPSKNMFTSTGGDSKVLGSMDIDESDSNSYSVTMHIKYGEFDALLTGDLSPEMDNDLIAKNLIGDVEYLQVPHHGSKNGLTKELLEKASPEVSVISVGKHNRYGHPAQEILDLLKDYKYLRTDQVGDIVVESDGKSFIIR